MSTIKKVTLSFTIIVICAIVIFILTKTQQQSSQTNELKNKNEILFGLATGYGGLGDKAFNDMQFNGMLMAKRDHKIKFIYDSPKNAIDDYRVIQNLIDQKAEVIVAGGGFHMVDPVDSLAQKYPGIKFIIIDDMAKHYYPNVASVMFKQSEGSYLAGAFAAMESKSGHIAMIGAIDIDIINDFYIGFKSGAQYVKPNIQVSIKYIGKYDDPISPFANPKKAFDIATNLYTKENVDIIYQVASGSGIGVFNAAKQYKKYAIGVDSDQDYLAEGFILTSMLKRLDIGIDMIIGNIINNQFQNKAYILGLKDKGVSLSEMKFTKDKINPETLKKINQIQQDIINNIIKVPTLYP